MARLNNNNENRFVLRDYHHAAKTFTTEPGYTKTPYNGFLFHVNVSFNRLVPETRSIEVKDISVLVKESDLPEIRFETETLNQYNRKRIVNKKVEYQPVKLTFHDDIANNVRNMWIAYNQHYSADSSYVDENVWRADNVYNNDEFVRPYGLDVDAEVPFINKVEIYSMGNGEYSKMLLVNPVLTAAKFDNHTYSEGAKIMEMDVTVEYENIIYSTGTVDQIPGFGQDNAENYDLNGSSLGTGVQFAGLGSAFERDPVLNNPISRIVLSELEERARQIDPIVGNVLRSNITRISGNQYQQIQQRTASTYSRNQKPFVFPDTNIRENAVPLTSRLSTEQNTVARSNSVRSNGSTVATSSVSTSVRQSPVNTVGGEPGEIIINPRAQRNLSPAEQALFQKSYPPLPSTDARTRLPPYV